MLNLTKKEVLEKINSGERYYKYIKYLKYNDDEKIAIASIKQSMNAFPYLSKRLKDDKDFILKVISISESCLDYLNNELNNDYEILDKYFSLYKNLESDFNKQRFEIYIKMKEKLWMKENIVVQNKKARLTKF